MRPISNKSARLYATAKTHKFKNLDGILIDKLQLKPIIDQRGTFTFDTSKALGKYLKQTNTKLLIFKNSQTCLKIYHHLKITNSMCLTM